MMKKIGLIGAGNISRNRHLPGFTRADNAVVAGIVSQTAARRTQLCADFDIPDYGDDPEKLFQDPDIDAVCIATWPDSHLDLARRALAAGKHVLVEGRMARNAGEALDMKRLADASGRQAWLVPAPASLAYDQVILDMLADGRLGNISYVTAKECNTGFPVEGPAASFRTSRAQSGLNFLFLGVLFESLLRWFGAPEVVQGRLLWPGNAGGDDAFTNLVPNHADVILDFPNDIAGTLSVSGRNAAPGPAEIRIHGDKASLLFDVDAESLSICEDGESWQPVVPAIADGDGWTVEQDFANVISGGAPGCLTSFAQGVDYMSFTEAVWQSHQQQRRIALPLDPDKLLSL